MAKLHKGMHHPQKGHKVGKPAAQGSGKGSNLKLPNPAQSMHVSPAKDKMAGNVGGDAHMAPSSKSMGYQDLIKSGAKGVKKSREKY